MIKTSTRFSLPAFFLSVLVSGFFFLPSPALADAQKQEQQARDFVNSFTDKVLSDIKDKSSEEEKIDFFRTLFDETVDLDAGARFVLGTHFKQADKDQYARFLAAFRETVLLTWVARFREYNNQQIRIIQIRPSDSGKDIFVEAEVVDSAPPAGAAAAQKPISFVCRLRTMKDGGFKIMDIIIEGVSMLTTYKAEYSGFLAKNEGNIDTLIATMEKKNAQLHKEATSPRQPGKEI